MKSEYAMLIYLLGHRYADTLFTPAQATRTIYPQTHPEYKKVKAALTKYAQRHCIDLTFENRKMENGREVKDEEGNPVLVGPWKAWTGKTWAQYLKDEDAYMAERRLYLLELLEYRQEEQKENEASKPFEVSPPPLQERSTPFWWTCLRRGISIAALIAVGMFLESFRHEDAPPSITSHILSTPYHLTESIFLVRRPTKSQLTFHPASQKIYDRNQLLPPPLILSSTNSRVFHPKDHD